MHFIMIGLQKDSRISAQAFLTAAPEPSIQPPRRLVFFQSCITCCLSGEYTAGSASNTNVTLFSSPSEPVEVF